LVVLYGVAINNQVDYELAQKMDQAATQHEANYK
jgi:hypothetical protein